MIVAIADTHAVIWYLYADARLGRAASAFIDETVAQGNLIGVSAMSVAEMVYLVEKRRIPANAMSDLNAAIADLNAVLQHVAWDEKVAMKMADISRQDVPDLPGRAIAATAHLLGVPILSRDTRIRSSTLETIW